MYIKKQIMKTKELQNRIFNLINGIEASEKAKKHFLGIISVIYGHQSIAYQDFEALITDPQKQLEMLRAPDNHKYKSNFMVFCHVVVEDYIEQALSSSSKDSSGFLPYNYFVEIEKASQHKAGIIGFELKRCSALNIEETGLTRFLLSPLADCLTDVEYRKILSVWFMYPELIFHADKVGEVINHFCSGK